MERSVLSAACKILGLLCVYRFISYLSTAVSLAFSLMWLTDPSQQAFYRTRLSPVIVSTIFMLVAAFFLIKRSGLIVAALAPSEGELPAVDLGSLRQQKSAFGIGARILGAWALLSHLPYLLQFAILYAYQRANPIMRIMQGGDWLNAIGTAIVAALGIYFILGAKGLAELAFRTDADS